MTGRTHLAAGMLCGEALAVAGNCNDIRVIGAVVIVASIGSLLSDIDHPRSTLSNASITTKTISNSISAFSKHRGFTHTPAFMALITVALYYALKHFPTYRNIFVEALALGMLSHLLLDSLNERGIMWFWPLTRKHFHIAKIHADSAGEVFVRIILNVGVTVITIKITCQLVLPLFEAAKTYFKL